MTRRLARPYAVVGGRTTPALPGLRVPLGVARVLVADAAAEGGVRIDIPDDAPLSVELLQRVLDGLRGL